MTTKRQSAGGTAEVGGALGTKIIRGGVLDEPTDDEIVRALNERGLLSTVGFKPVYDYPSLDELTLEEIFSFCDPEQTKDEDVALWRYRNRPVLERELAKLAAARAYGIGSLWGALWISKIDGEGKVTNYGLASMRVVTDVGCQKIVAIMNTSDATAGKLFKYHGIGTGTASEAATDTALGTELTTQYNPDNTRATGTQTTGATTKVYRTVGTNTLDSGLPAVTEHGVLTQAATGGGSLLDRSKFAAINLNGTNGDGLQTTYDLTFTSGG